jgi:hypothetical protein
MHLETKPHPMHNVKIVHGYRKLNMQECAVNYLIDDILCRNIAVG